MAAHLDADAAVDLFGSRARVLSSPACATPETLLAALGRRAASRPGTTVVAGMLLGSLPFLDAVRAGDLRLRTWHVTGGARRLAEAGVVGYVPLRLGDVARHLPGMVDAMVLRVSPPDRHGRCSFGPSGSYTRAGIDAVRACGGMVVAEIDPYLPRTTGAAGATTVAFDELDATVDADTPTCTYRPAERLDTHRRIAATVVACLPERPTVQLGIGAVPEAVTDALGSVPGGARLVGMAGDGIVGLLEAGALRSPPGEPAVLAVEVVGSSTLLRVVHDNPEVEVVSSATLHDPRRLGELDRLCSVNAALEVDLTGQVALEGVGDRAIAGLGGAVDFFEGAHLSPGGLRIVALASTDPTGATSRIVGLLAPGTPVSLPRHAVDLVVTEHGVADLRAATLAERAEALVAVAAPAHRAALSASLGQVR